MHRSISLLRLYIEGIGILAGMIVGAARFALPFVSVRAGWGWAAFHLLLAFFFMLILHLLYAEVSYHTDGRHRFIGYVRALLGGRASGLAVLLVFFGYYGTLLIYGV